MKLKDILAIGGKPGLYRFIAQAKNGIIVESFADKKRLPAYASDKVSALDDIAIFSEESDIPLKEVFKRIYTKENGGKTIGSKSSGDTLKAYFEEIVPEYDKERVYTSDIKKVLGWYNILQELGMLSLEDEEEENLENQEKQEKENGEENGEENE